MRNKFQAKFLKLLQEAPELDFDPAAEEAAAVDQMDDGVDAGDYAVDVDPDPNAIDEIGDAVVRQNEQMVSIVNNWNTNIEKFLEYLNGDQPNSVQSVLGNANPESLLGNLKNQQVKIGRIASDLAALQQAFLTAKKNQ